MEELMQRVITLGTGKRITLGSYVKAVKVAKANPDVTFREGLTSWWPTTGAEVVQQFRRGMHDRINQAVPYNARGRING
jgi:hypothetical protein